MKHPSLFRRMLSMALVFAMLVSLLIPVTSAEPAKHTGNPVEELTLIPIDPGTLQSQKLGQTSNEAPIHREDYALTDIVRVSIVMEKPSTLDLGFSTERIASNPLAKIYRSALRAEQAAVTAKIEQRLGEKLDVKWNLTLAANNISANVAYGDIERIKAVDGVKDVFLEICYEPQTDAQADEPNNGSASDMIGANITWADGLTGAGSRLAVIDTGTDKDHQSFSGEALEYALRQNAEEKGMSYEAYVKSLNLLTVEEIDAVKDQLNVSISSADRVYSSTKLPFGYCYVDGDYDFTHENDERGEHGSHVAGISTANRFIKVGEEFQPALDTACTQGVAPDAQLITMKVFGNKGGAYESDYMAAIEDAIVLGCDSANLSLGSATPGFSFSSGYEKVLNKLVENGMVCTISAGNSGMWYGTPKNSKMYSFLYTDDVNFHTGGSPGTFTNALTVASSDNVGNTGIPLIFGERRVFYNETSYKNEPIATLAGNEYDYILIDGPGVDDNNHVGKEGDQFLALGSELLTGKIAICYRGTSSFFAKANAAVEQGAVGVIIINNQDGTINMQLEDYKGPAPAVSILKVDGDAIKAASEAVKDDAGNVLYYTGKMSVAPTTEIYKPETITDTIEVSSFSSYGVPGSLLMKPEILAPGGSIYSVFGYNKLENGNYAGGHDKYEMMSGTSMAAPQINGMAAIMAQYIRENDLCKKTGLSQRQLINSLLMSTAHPVFDADGEYWATIRVGAGQANVADAVRAKSYIMMDEDATLFPDSAKDGKVKAELGDDPERTGKYDFSFTVTPLEGKKEFTLRTDIFTQGIAGNGGYGMLQDTATMRIGAEATYEVNGETYKNSYPEADVNMDGETNAADAQAILDHISGEEKEGAKFDAEVADVDGDGEITTYDAKLLLESAQTPAIEVDGATKVTVHIQLNQSTIEMLDGYFENGFFVQGYTYVEPVADEEGNLDVVHSIPILGFFGSWTDPSMFDRTSAIDEAYGTGKLPYIGNTNINYLVLKDTEGNPTIYMGNPYTVEKTFPADRLAMKSDATVDSYSYLNIRNAAVIGFAVQDEAGKVLYSQISTGNRWSAFYHVNDGTWQNTAPSTYRIGKTLNTVNGVKEGEQITVGFYALPEYINIALSKLDGKVATEGAVDDIGFKKALEAGLVGDGAAIKYTVTVDDTAPVIADAVRDLITGDIKVTASDDCYIAYVGVLNKSGTTVYAGAVPDQAEKGEEVKVSLNLEGQRLPDEVVLLVGDYAGNETAVRVALGGGDEENLAGLTFAFTSASGLPGSGNRMLEIDRDTLTYNYKTSEFTGLSVAARTSFAVEAAEYVEGYIFMAGDDGNFYAMKLNDTEDISLVGAFKSVTATVYDMAYNYQNKKLYVLGENNILYTMDLFSGELTKVAEITITNPKSAANRTLKDLAIDGEGNFYSANILDINEFLSQVYLYKFNLSMMDAEGKIKDLDPVNNASDGGMGTYNMKWGGSMAWDHNTNQLYVISNYLSGSSQKKFNANVDGWNGLFVVNLETGKATPANEAGKQIDDNGQFNSSAALGNACSGLIIVPGSVEAIKPSETAKSLTVDPMSLTMLKGQTSTLKETLAPWTLTDKSVTWKSNDESVVTVQNGKVTAIAVGETTVTVTTNAEPHLSVDVSVKVIDAPEAELRAIVWNESAKGMASVFKSNDTANWEGIAEVGPFRWGALVDDRVYASTDSKIFAYDADTYEVKEFDAIAKMWVFSDATFLPEDLAQAAGLKGSVIGPCSNGRLLEVLNPETGVLNYWDMSSKFSNDPMATIAYGGRDGLSAVYYVLTETGDMYKLVMDTAADISVDLLGSTGLDLTGVSDVGNDIYASLYYSEENQFFYLSYCNGTDDIANLYAINANDLACNGIVGNFKKSVWPVVGLHAYTPATDLLLKVEPTELVVYEGETEPVNIQIKLGETNEYTAEVADPAVCSFENGVVTGLSAGETTITVTTVDSNDAGQKLSETVKVTVKAYKQVDISVFGQVTDEQGARFTEISLNGAVASDEGVEAPGSLVSGGRSAELYLGALTTNGKTVAKVLDAETLQPTDAWYNVYEPYFDFYPPTDIAKMPRLVDKNGTVMLDEKFIFTSTLGWLVRPNFYGWDLKSTVGLDAASLAGICLWYVTPSTTAIAADLNYLLLTTSGDLYALQLKLPNGELYAGRLFETGITFEDQMDCSMTVVQDTEKGISGIAVVNNGDKKLYFIDFAANTPEEAVGYVGMIDAEHVSGLVGALDADMSDTMVGPRAPQEISFDFNSNPTEAGWTVVDADGDGRNWYYEAEAGRTGGCMRSVSWDSDLGESVDANNYLVSPALDLSGMSNPVASFYVKIGMEDYADQFQILAGTSADVAAMTVVGEVTTGTESWTEYSLNLSELAGQNGVYVALRHCSDYCESIYADDFCVRETSAGGSIEQPVLGKAFRQLGDGRCNANVPAFTEGIPMTKMSETVNETTGGTNAVRGAQSTLNDTRKPVCMDPIVANGKVSIDLSDDEATTNGLYVLTYDAEALTYVDAVSKLPYISIHNEVKEKVGTITVAYASTDVIKAEHVIATLNFSYEGEIDTEIKIETIERNDNVAVEEEPVVISLTEHVCPCAHFTDMPEYGTVEHAAIDWAFTHDPQITNGMDETTFRPDVIVNRGQAVTFLWRAKEKPAPANTENPFTDVEEGRFFYDAVLWAVNCDPQITNGVTETSFAPFKTCNRAEILTFLWRTMGRPEPEGECPYSDVPAERYFAKAATWAYENGIYKGADGLFQPTEDCTRSDVVVFLYRYFTHKGLAE